MADEKRPIFDDAADRDEFTRLFTVSQRSIYIYIRSLVANSADVDEIWGETNLVLWQRFADYRPGTNFLAWAKRIAYNKVLNWRTRRPQPIQFSDVFLDRLAATADRGSGRDGAYLDALSRCAEKLPSTDRSLIELRYGPDATCGRIAEITGRSVRSIYKALARIRTDLLDCIRREVSKEERE